MIVPIPHHSLITLTLRRKFDSDVKREQGEQNKLKKEVEALKKQLQEQHQVIQSQNTAIARYKSAEEVWANRYKQSETQIADWKELYLQEQVSTSNLVQTVSGRDEKIVELQNELEQCHATVARIQQTHRKKIDSLVASVQKQLSGTMFKMKLLDKSLADQSRDLHEIFDESLLDEVPLPELATASESTSEDDVVNEEALRRAAEAASNVLK